MSLSFRQKCIYGLFAILTLRFGSYELETRLTRVESCLKDLDEYMANTYVFIYPTIFDSSNHTFSWHLTYLEYLIVFYSWLRARLKFAPKLTPREQLYFRELLVWFHMFVYSGMTIVCLIFIYFHDDPQLWLVFGLPLYKVPKIRILLTYLAIGFMALLLIRYLFYYREKRNQVEVMRIIESLTSGGLKEKYVQEIAWKLAYTTDVFYWLGSRMVVFFLPLGYLLYSIPVFFWGKELDENYYFTYLGLQDYFSYWTFFAFPAVFLVLISFAWSVGNSICFTFAVLYLSQLILVYRFVQLNDKLKKKQSDKSLKEALHEHNYLSGLVIKNNLSMSVCFFIIYYMVSPALDILIYEAFYLQADWIIVFMFKLIALVEIICFFIATYSSVGLYNAAHSSYKRLNTFVAKYHIPIDLKLKLLFYIERFSGPPITNYCLDLFAITPYEHYLFVAAVSSNFFLVVDLINKYFYKNNRNVNL
jgi:hypothetical protein